jgi:uncharacterized protein (TIGR03437 family)
VQPSNLTVQVNFGALGAAGLYQAVITVRDTGSGSSVSIPVAVTQIAQQSQIGVNVSSLLFATSGGTVPNQVLRIFNLGGGTMAWSIGNVEFSPSSGNNWLTLSATSGTVVGTGQTSSVTFSINQNAQTLAAGVYQALIPISASGATNSPLYVTVTLQRVPSTAPPQPDIRPAGLFFVARVGGAAPAADAFTISNQGGGSLTAQISASTASGDNWLNVSSPGGTVTNPLTTQVSVNPAGLAIGIYRGTVRSTFTTGESLDVEVVLIVTPAPTSARLPELPQAALAGCTPNAMELVPNSIGNGAILPVSFPRNLRVTLIDSCGEFVDDATVVGTVEGRTIPMPLLRGNGVYSGTWVPEQQSAAVPIRFAALHATLPTLNRSFQVSTVPAAGGIQLPVLLPDGVVEAAGFTPQRPLAPGGFISLFGSRFATQSAGATAVPLPRELGGVRVKIGNIDAPLHYVSPGQINAQMPLEAQPGGSVSIVVSANGVLTAPQTYLIAPVMPGIFVSEGRPAVLRFVPGEGEQAVTPANPARIGDVLEIFATGLGATDPAVASGAPGPAFSTVTRPVTVTVGGVNAVVEYQGLAPGYVALYQVNIRVPAGVTPGDAVPLVITQNGVTGNLALPAAISVRGQ